MVSRAVTVSGDSAAWLAEGFAGGAAFGPVNVRVSQLGLTHWPSAARFACGAWTADSIVCIAAGLSLYEGAQHLLRNAQFRGALFICGGFALQIVAGAPLWRRARTKNESRASWNNSGIGQFLAGFMISISSPLGLAFWGGLGDGAAVSGHTGLALTLVIVGDLSWFVIWLPVLRFLGTRLSTRYQGIIGVVSGFLIGLFGIAFILVGSFGISGHTIIA